MHPTEETAVTTTLDTVPKPIMPGAEMADLLRFHRDISWTGTIAEGGMGPGTPAMTASGSGTHTLIQDGRWVVGDYRQDQHLLDGTHVLTWQLHWVAGWDPALGEYRATVADCYGHAEVMGGRIDGDRLVFESIGDPPARIRLTWNLVGPDTIVWRNETSAGGGPWVLIEEYRCTPVRRGEPAAPARRSELLEAVRRFNKRTLNPLKLHSAGRRHWYAARLDHVGRRSGRAYATPVIARPVPGGFAIPLAYGRDVDWHRNLTAAGRGVLTVHGTRYTITRPHTVPAAEITSALTPYWRRVLRGIGEYVAVSAEPLNPAGSGGCA